MLSGRYPLVIDLILIGSTPAPGMYTTAPIMPRMPAYTIGKRYSVKIANTPGPGAYDVTVWPNEHGATLTDNSNVISSARSSCRLAEEDNGLFVWRCLQAAA